MTLADAFIYLTNLFDVTQDQRVALILIIMFLVILYVIILASGEPQ